MMTVSVKFMLYLESAPELSVGKKTISVEVKDGATFGELLEGLDKHFGAALAKEIYDPGKRALQDMVLAIINGTLVHNFDDTDTVLHNGDTIIFVPIVMGG